MLVDSTNLLNQRHLDATLRDGKWTHAYPEAGMLPFDSVIRYDDGDDFNGHVISPGSVGEAPDVVIVSYGNGVPTSLLARRKLKERSDFLLCL